MSRRVCRQCDERKDQTVLVSRSTGGSYNRAPRSVPTTICLDCAVRLVAMATPGHRSVSRWDLYGLKKAIGQ